MDIQAYITTFSGFINTSVIPFILALALLFFLVNALRYFIIGGGNEDAREKARALAVWGILAFVLIITFWGIINIFITLFGIGGGSPIIPDYRATKP